MYHHRFCLTHIITWLPVRISAKVTNLKRLVVLWKEELVEELSLPVCPGSVADVCPLPALDVWTARHVATEAKKGISQSLNRDSFYVLFPTLLHLPPFRFHCVGRFWVTTQNCCETFALAARRSNHSARSYPQLARTIHHSSFNILFGISDL